MGTLGCAKQSIDYSNRKKSGQEWGACGAPCERAGGRLQQSQVSMSHRQQQQSAVQHAVRQALSPVSSLRRSSTTYTAGTGELGQSAQHSDTHSSQRLLPGTATAGTAVAGTAAVPRCTQRSLAVAPLCWGGVNLLPSSRHGTCAGNCVDNTGRV